ncbi:MAG: hypothetical protein Q9191_006124 [Dirinaria sp. TL-2023a]
MNAMTKESLKARLSELIASVEALPADVFSDEPLRNRVQQQISGLQAALGTPLEAVFDIFLQVGFQPVLECVARILRALTATGVIDERGPKTYAINPISQTLLDPGWTNGLKHFFYSGAPVLLKLPEYIARNGHKVPHDVKTGPFADTHGKNTWAFYEAEPARGEIFNSFMNKWRGGISHCLRIFLLVDVGGGEGQMLQDFVTQQGRRKNRLIVQDLPAPLIPAKKLQSLGIEAMPYDFFTPQPVKEGKAYYFRAIFHDWPDKACQDILRNTVVGMKRGYSKILIDELVLPNEGVSPIGAFMDLTMLAIETGSERTSQQWYDLLGSVGLRIEKIWPPTVGPYSLIEAELSE